MIDLHDVVSGRRYQFTNDSECSARIAASIMKTCHPAWHTTHALIKLRAPKHWPNMARYSLRIVMSAIDLAQIIDEGFVFVFCV